MAQPLIMVVDDSPDLRQIFRDILEQHGFPVAEAATGEAAVALAKRRKPALIFMDLLMPMMNGWQATAELKAGPLSDIPIIAVTSLEPSRARVREAGFCGLIRKPLLPRDVLRAVTVCLEAVAAGETWIEDLQRRLSLSESAEDGREGP